MASPLARSWWLFALAGAVNVILGLLAIAHPGFTLLAIGIVLGIYLLLAALFAIIDGITGDAEGRGTSIVLGIVALIAGLICVRRPGETLLALVIAAGVYLVVAGVIRLIRAIVVSDGRGIALLIGGLDLALGVLVLALPEVSLGTLAVLVGISMLVRGCFDLILAFQFRKLREHDPGLAQSPGVAT